MNTRIEGSSFVANCGQYMATIVFKGRPDESIDFIPVQVGLEDMSDLRIFLTKNLNTDGRTMIIRMNSMAEGVS